MVDDRFARIVDKPDLVRDRKSGAVLSINRDHVKAARARKAHAIEQEARMKRMETSIAELTELVKTLINKQ